MLLTREKQKCMETMREREKFMNGEVQRQKSSM